MEIPAELEAHVLVWHGGLDYVDFYQQLSEMVSCSLPLDAMVISLTRASSPCTQDLILPILRSHEYIQVRATAAFPAGIIAHVPSLVMPHQLKSYNYLEPPAIVLHPDGTSEVQVVAAMRRGEDPWTSVADEAAVGRRPADEVLHSSLLDAHGRIAASVAGAQGNDWNTYTDSVRTYNARMLCKALLR